MNSVKLTNQISILCILAFVLLPSNYLAQIQQEISWPTLFNSQSPMIHVNPQSNGRTKVKGPQAGHIKWIRDMPNGIFNGPVVGPKDNLYFGSYYVGFQPPHGESFYSYTSNGSLLWEFITAESSTPNGAILIDSDTTIYFTCIADSLLYALYPNGDLKWKINLGGYPFQLGIINIDLMGNLYLAIRNSYLLCINKDGNINWSYYLGNNYTSHEALSPTFAPDGKTIYISGLDSNLFALNLDGTLKWTYSCGKNYSIQMVDSDGNIYIVSTEPTTTLESISPEGILRWDYTILNHSFNDLSSFAMDKEGNIYLGFIVYIISFDYYGNFRWQYNFSQGEEIRQPLICDIEGTIYCGSSHGNFYYAISCDGELIWKVPLNEWQADNTTAFGTTGTLYIGLHKGIWYANQVQTLLAISDDTTTSIHVNYSNLSFKLNQNYPNPFNPYTNISFEIPTKGFTTLEVYNTLGQRVSVLVDELRESGTYEEHFNSSDLPSGTYFCKLQSGNLVSVKKMILLK